jgi:hypothetical protein
MIQDKPFISETDNGNVFVYAENELQLDFIAREGGWKNRIDYSEELNKNVNELIKIWHLAIGNSTGPTEIDYPNKTQIKQLEESKQRMEKGDIGGEV